MFSHSSGQADRLSGSLQGSEPRRREATRTRPRNRLHEAVAIGMKERLRGPKKRDSGAKIQVRQYRYEERTGRVARSQSKGNSSAAAAWSVSVVRAVSGKACELARGWESKSVESQMEDHNSLTGPIRNTHADAGRERQLEVLKLARKHLLNEMEGVSNPRFLDLKRRALAHVEASIAALEPAQEGDRSKGDEVKSQVAKAPR
jgi:hypothetical protein